MRAQEAGYEIALAKVMCNVPEVRLESFRTYVNEGLRSDGPLQTSFMDGWHKAERDYNSLKKKGALPAVRKQRCTKLLARIDAQTTAMANR